MANENPFSLIYLVRISKKYLWYIGGVIGISALLAFILTLPAIYKPEFKSSTVIYPTNPERYDLSGLFDEEPRIYLYGNSKETEKLDNIANSEEVKLFVIDSLNLWDIYGVDPENDASPKYYAFRTYGGNVRTVKVEGNGLKIEAFDIDPQRAADIVNLIVKKVDETTMRMINRNKASIAAIYQKGYDNLARQLEEYVDSARKVREQYNIYHNQAQTEVLIEQILQIQAKVAASPNSSILRAQLKALTEKSGGAPVNLEKFREGYDKAQALDEITTFMARDLKDTREKLENLTMMTQTHFSTLLVPEAARPADRKARPIRWVIMVATVLLAALVSLIGAVLVDKITEIVAESVGSEQ